MGHFASPRLRVLYGSAIAIGPGKADLLDTIGRTGSISAAGRALGLSYRRAWLLVDTMNRCFREPLVVAVKGGPHGGGAQLTPFGADVLARYRALESRAAAAFGGLLAEVPPGSPSGPPPVLADDAHPIDGSAGDAAHPG
jgi:molybdate transport system regulatory protein